MPNWIDQENEPAQRAHPAVRATDVSQRDCGSAPTTAHKHSRLIQSDWLKKVFVGVLLLVAVLSLSRTDYLQRLDNLFYDVFITVHHREAANEFLIVAIDDKSLRELGRWPWPRRVHARLIDTLSVAQTAAVGMDILFVDGDPSDPGGDAELARAMVENGRVVLALAPESGAQGITELAPLGLFADAAAAVGHVDLELDSDGLVRKVFLKAGLAQPRWPAFGLALLEVAGGQSASTAGVAGLSTNALRPVWSRDLPTLIAYAGPPGHFNQVSYSDVLNGRVDMARLNNKIVLVGASASGMGDFLSTPRSSAHSLMSGVEVNANVAATIAESLGITESTLLQRGLLAVLLMLPLSLCMLVKPRLALPGFLIALSAAMIVSLACLYSLKLWIAPSLAMILLSLLYVTWSWLDLGQIRRLSEDLGEQLHTATLYDAVTGLPNRAGFEKKICETINGRHDGDCEFGIFLISMGRHRSVIDLAGIGGNDDLHRQIAQRLGNILPCDNMLYRLEGAEFAVVLEEPSALLKMEQLAARAVQSLLRSFAIDGNIIEIVPNIGSSHYPGDARNAQALIDNAYTAMHWARKDKTCSYHAFSHELREDVSKRSLIVQVLRSPTWKEQLRCVYQPQISLQSRRIVGMETLVRWPHASLGNIPPAEFIPLAESEGLISPINNWILHQACMTTQVWREKYQMDLRVAVNISALQLNKPDLPGVVERVLKDTGLPAPSLELELTETALLSDHDHALEILQALKSLGVEIAIDDFGTGYSSLTYLKDFPVDRVKIDQSFISDTHTCRESAEIASSIITMSHRMGLNVIAEGVERAEHMAFLLRQGCEEAQGYFIAKPMSAGDFERLLIAEKIRGPGESVLAVDDLFPDAHSG